MKTLGKISLIIGITLLVLGVLGIAAGLMLSLTSVQTNGNAGIGAVGGAWLELALTCCIAAFLGVLAITAGVVLLLLQKRSEK